MNRLVVALAILATCTVAVPIASTAEDLATRAEECPVLMQESCNIECQDQGREAGNCIMEKAKKEEKWCRCYGTSRVRNKRDELKLYTRDGLHHLDEDGDTERRPPPSRRQSSDDQRTRESGRTLNARDNLHHLDEDGDTERRPPPSRRQSSDDQRTRESGRTLNARDNLHHLDEDGDTERRPPPSRRQHIDDENTTGSSHILQTRDDIRLPSNTHA
ncbi:uncharacterized protein CIMG_01182 [Coccidioides immitis RS]|uniref:Uncharacterized protein n=1 Tax=Coccidioides immitis (strain RS) TaxID=246410 RepID=A0A0E1S4T6_COCIM|nr:uncharacterized protein CIMG_01182 [Coccidioides immitis RS]EAS35828.1 hypothetical protein CIMG_01182 [Coccidioides immitis RS]